MKKILLLFIFSLAFLYLNAQCGSLYIGGVVDGPLSGGTPKAVQVCSNADIADLSIFGLGSANNGGGTDGQEYTFDPLFMAANTCIWIASESTEFTNFFGFEPCATSGAMSINGDDAIELFCNGAVVDLFGDINTDGNGEPWEYLDGWATRTNTTPSAIFDINDWNLSGVNGLEGGITNGTVTSPYPNPPTSACTLGSLPVELTDFNASQENRVVELSWTTASELNNSHFDIEFSQDGNNFRVIDEVIGNGTTQEKQEYSYTHTTPVNGANYYRLKQVDFDGAFEYSDILVVEIERTGKVIINPFAAIAEITVQLAETTGDNNQIGISI